MASIATPNVNELLPGLEDFLRSMLKNTHLDTDHRRVATMYLDKLDQYSQLTEQPSTTDIESDDFTDEEEEEEEQSISPSVLEQPSSVDPPHSSTSVLADGLLLTYDKDHQWLWRYYVLDDFDLICYPAEKNSRSLNQGQTDKSHSPLWVSDITQAKVHLTTMDKIQCLCLQIGLAEAIFIRPSDPNQLNNWLQAFRDVASSSRKPKDNLSKSFSRNARRMFAQLNRKKGQFVSQLLDQMANVTGLDEKSRKHYELRGFLVISLNGSHFLTKYCTIIDGIFRIHKSRLSEQTDRQLNLKLCILSFPEERTRDIQFALTDDQDRRIFIRGTNIYSMGRLLNTLAKYVDIQRTSTVSKDLSEKPQLIDRKIPQPKERMRHRDSLIECQSICYPQPFPRRLSIDHLNKCPDLPLTNPLERPTKFLIPPFQSRCSIDDEEDVTIYDNLSKSEGTRQFRFVVPFNHSPSSAFTIINPISSAIHSSSSTISSSSTMPQSSSSSSIDQKRLMTSV